MARQCFNRDAETSDLILSASRCASLGSAQPPERQGESRGERSRAMRTAVSSGATGLPRKRVAILPSVSAGATQIPLSKVIGALSYALDVTEGEPPGHAVRTCMIGMRLGEVLELPAPTRSHLFYALLLKDAGCSANSAKMAALFGADDHVAKRTSKRIDWSGRLPAFIWSMRTVAPGGSVRSRLERLLDIKEEGQVTRALMQARCDRGAEIALLLGLEPETAEAIRALDEHWDGAGQPRGLQGEEIPLLGRILCLAQTAEIFHAAGGFRAAYGVARKRRGGWFDPALVDALQTLGDDPDFWDSLQTADVAEWEPPDRPLLADDVRLDAIANAFAGVVDAKSPWTYRHSDRTSLIVLGLANALGADGPAMRDLRRAALLHDIGKLSISNRILDKPAALTRSEFARVCEHPIVTERILSRVPGCEHLATLAAAHHERLDGSGYPHGLDEQQLTLRMRVLAMADVYEALTSERPYRRALSSDDALAVIRSEVPERLDPEVYGALERLLSGGEMPERELVDVPAQTRRRR
jgi:HD-GYP domain-containing protein (c-di-GMP phosphodiesterase class II)